MRVSTGNYARWRNPYDSPRVLRAVLDDVSEQIVDYLSSQLTVLKVSPNLQTELQFIVDSLTAQVSFRGSPLHKLLHMVVGVSTHDLTPDVVFHISPASDDGRWLLEKMGLVEPKEAMKVKELPKPNQEFFKRVVEI